VVFLDRSSGTLRINEMVMSGEAQGLRDQSRDESGVIRLSPRVREDISSHDAIPSIPVAAIAPFLSRPLVIEKNELKGAPALIGAREGRVILGEGDTCFARGLASGMGDKWQIYRPGKEFIDPDSGELLGIEAVYLGDAEVTQFGEISTMLVTHSVQETYRGDRLVKPSVQTATNYLPRAPENKISARVISVYGGVSQAGQNTAITLNKGSRDGMEIGHVLALYRKGEEVKSEGEKYTLPDERYGLIFVFRVFDKVSYALVMQTKRPVELLDRALNP
jgi:hypothetical protein